MDPRKHSELEAQKHPQVLEWHDSTFRDRPSQYTYQYSCSCDEPQCHALLPDFPLAGPVLGSVSRFDNKAERPNHALVALYTLGAHVCHEHVCQLLSGFCLYCSVFLLL